MLQHLAIRDLGIIESCAVDFAEGLNVLTGETGAGKSLVVGALNLVLGDRARSDAIRHGCRRAEVQALFRIPADGALAARLRERDLLDEGDEEAAEADTRDVVVRRVIAPGGKGRAHVNGVLVNVGTLAELTRGLVDLTSQHQHTALRDPSTHLDLLDRFGGLESMRASYETAWSALAAARRERDQLREEERTRLQREDWLRFQLGEIDEVEPVAGEEDELEQERRQLAHAEELTKGGRDVEQSLTGGGSAAQDRILEATQRLERLAELDPELQPYLSRLETARIELEDVGFEMRRYADRVDMEPRRLEQIEERLHALGRLRRKHGLDAAGLAERAEELRAELERFESLEDSLARADERVAEREAEARAHAETLSEARARAAEELAARVDAELDDLAMADARVRFALERREELGPRGLDEGQLEVQTNAGEGYKPLSRVASGGELSRLLLAFEGVAATASGAHAAVFDEVDTGVGGGVAEAIGLKLKEMTRQRQVIAITHLPQIAAHADHHLEVSKGTREGRTTTEVRTLGEDERAEEVARMLGGLEITRRTREHARELLARTARA